jgi:hypothetical protein
MKKINLLLAVAIGGLMLPQAASATTYVVNFDPPAFATGPSVFVQASPSPQTIVTTPATFTGGVILGDATAFPAIVFATAPNVYGTADFGNGLSETLSVAINPSVTINEVSFALFNGTSQQSYVATAFNGGSQVSSQTLNNVPSNNSQGFGLIDLKSSAGITSVLISPVGNPTSWDFVIDTVAFNESIQAAVAPLPASWTMMLSGLAVFGFMAHRRSKRNLSSHASMAV